MVELRENVLGIWTIASEENYTRLGLDFGLGLVLGLRAIFLRGNCPRAISNSTKTQFNSKKFSSNTTLCTSYRTVPSAIWQMFFKFFVFFRFISRAFRRVK